MTLRSRAAGALCSLTPGQLSTPLVCLFFSAVDTAPGGFAWLTAGPRSGGRGGNCPRPRPPWSAVFSPARSFQVELVTRKQSAKSYHDGVLAGPDS